MIKVVEVCIFFQIRGSFLTSTQRSVPYRPRCFGIWSNLGEWQSFDINRYFAWNWKKCRRFVFSIVLIKCQDSGPIFPQGMWGDCSICFMIKLTIFVFLARIIYFWHNPQKQSRTRANIFVKWSDLWNGMEYAQEFKIGARRWFNWFRNILVSWKPLGVIFS